MVDGADSKSGNANSFNLRLKVYEQIKTDIITCRLAPGEPLSEGQFVDRFKVSKTPIREALTSLLQDRLVEYLPNRGFRVTSIALRDIQEIFEARLFYESSLFKLAVKRITELEISQLETRAEVPYDWNNPSALDEYLQDNLKFHLGIAQAARNSRLYWQYTNLLNEAQRLIYMDFKENAIRPIWHRSHHRFIEALRLKDEALGLGAIEESIESAKRRILGA